MLLAGLLISYLNRFRNSLFVAFPTARRAIRFPIVPFLIALTSPKILADLYKNDLILLILIFPRPFCVGDFIITKFLNVGHPQNTHETMIKYDFK